VDACYQLPKLTLVVGLMVIVRFVVVAIIIDGDMVIVITDLTTDITIAVTGGKNPVTTSVYKLHFNL
jgi:hypothetical protein